MSKLAPLAPVYTQGQTVSPAAVAASITIGIGTKQLTLTNTGASICYVRSSEVAVSATAADFPVLAGTQVTISKATDYSLLSYISPAGTTLHIIPGEGW